MSKISVTGIFCNVEQLGISFIQWIPPRSYQQTQFVAVSIIICRDTGYY